MNSTDVRAQGTSVQSLISQSAVWVDPDLTLREACGVLAANSIGAALVRGPHGRVGLVSERDIVAALADDAKPSHTRVDEVCTWDLATVAPLATVEDAARTMLAAEVRHLPVMADGHTTELISERDVLRIYASPA